VTVGLIAFIFLPKQKHYRMLSTWHVALLPMVKLESEDYRKKYAGCH